MATQNINIVITANGGVTVVRSLQQIAQAAQAAISPLNLLQRTLQSVMAALAVRQLADWADEWTTAANKVAVFAQSQAETNEVLERLYNVANRVGQPLNSVVDLYHKLSIQSKELGISTNDNIRFTENVSKALTIQGTSANTAKGTLLQLSQAMGTGKVKAQEYNSILTGAPLILKLVAENIDKTGGSVAKLTAMQRAGHLTSMMLYNGIMSATAKLDEMWGKATRTFEQGWTVLINGITKFLGKLNEATGASNTFYKIATFLSENFDTIAKLLIVVGAGIVAAFAPAIITAFAGALVVAAGALGTLSMLLLANPFAVIAAAVAAVIAFGDSWSAGIDGITTVKDLARALWEELAAGWDTVKWAAIGMWTDLVAMVQTVYNDLTGLASGATGDWITAYTIFFDDTKGGFVGLLQSIARVMDAIAGLIIGTVIGITRVFSGLPAVISDIFAQVYNAIAGWMEKAINVVIDGINTVRAKTGAGLIDAVKIEQKSVNANVYKQYGESIGASINEGFDIQGGFMEKKILGWADRAQQIAKKRLASQGGPRPDLDVRGTPADIIEKAKKGGKGPKDNSENEIKKLENALRSLLDKIDPVNGALLEMAKAQKILTDAVSAGLIKEPQRLQYLERLAYYYRDMIDPIQKVYRELDIEAAKMDGLADERERNNKLYDIQVQLMQAGKPANAAEIEVLKTKILLNQQLNEQMQIQDQLIANGPGTRKKEGQTMQGIADLLKSGKGGFTKDDATSELQSKFPDLFAGTQEAIDLRISQFDKMYKDIDQMRQLELISESTASQMKSKVWLMEQQQQLSYATQFFGSLEGLATSSNRKVAAIGKAAAITNATIKAYEAANVAYASAPYPYSIALAAAAIVAGMANVAKIASTNVAFATGGSFNVGGSGGADSQMVAFRASPGEQVQVRTPEQVRKGSAAVNGSAGAANAKPMSVKIINNLDPQMLSEYLASPEGQQVLVNTIRGNSEVVRAAIS